MAKKIKPLDDSQPVHVYAQVNDNGHIVRTWDRYETAIAECDFGRIFSLDLIVGEFTLEAQFVDGGSDD